MQKTIKSFTIWMTMIVLLPVMGLFIGCGNPPAANSTDVLTGPASVSFDATNGGGTRVYYAPLVFTLLDSSGKPRNNIAIDFFTDGIFYTDNTYTEHYAGGGLANYLSKETDPYGTVTLYWATETLPVCTSVDQKGESYIEALSGAVKMTFAVSWTVPACS